MDHVVMGRSVDQYVKVSPEEFQVLVSKDRHHNWDIKQSREELQPPQLGQITGKVHRYVILQRTGDGTDNSFLCDSYCAEKACDLLECSCKAVCITPLVCVVSVLGGVICGIREGSQAILDVCGISCLSTAERVRKALEEAQRRERLACPMTAKFLTASCGFAKDCIVNPMETLSVFVVRDQTVEDLQPATQILPSNDERLIQASDSMQQLGATGGLTEPLIRFS